MNRYIRLDLLKKFSATEWGYKDMDESMGPYEASCPLKFLDMVPEPTDSKYAHDFRERVREYWAQRTLSRKPKIGDVYEMAKGVTLNKLPLKHAEITDITHQGKRIIINNEARMSRVFLAKNGKFVYNRLDAKSFSLL